MRLSSNRRKINLDRISIIVPTYSRKEYLLRTLEFISSYNFGNVIVVDGTPGVDWAKEVAYKFPKATYIHSERGFVQRIALAIPLVQSEYVALWGDDEYWLPSFFLNAMEFLSNNPDYVHCIGLAVSFSTTPSIEIMPEYPALRNLHLPGVTPSSRLHSRFQNYVWGGLWGVARTSAWAKSWAASMVQEFPVRGATEIQFEAGMAWQGKVKVLQELAWFRSSESSSLVSSADISLHHANPMFHEWWMVASPFEQRRFIESFQIVSDLTPKDVRAFERTFRHYSLSILRPGICSRILNAINVLVNSTPKLHLIFKNKRKTRERNVPLGDSSSEVKLEIEDFLDLQIDGEHLLDLKNVLRSLRSFVVKNR